MRRRAASANDQPSLSELRPDDTEVIPPSETDPVEPMIEMVAPTTLRPHPLLKHIPEKADDDPQFTALIENIRDVGILEPVLIDVEDRILCGRHRRRAAKILGLPVPCRRLESDRAADVILAELCLARHLTKSALAYLALPLLAPALEAARERKIRLLQSVQKNGVSRCSEAIGHKMYYGEEIGPVTVEKIAAAVGLSRMLIFQAQKLNELFTKIRQKHGEPAVAAIETELLGGETSLGYAITAATNVLRNAERPSRLDKRQEFARLFVQSFRRSLLHWDKATAEQKKEITRELRLVAAETSPALRAEMRKAFR